MPTFHNKVEHFLTGAELDANQVWHLLDLAQKFKHNRQLQPQLLQGKTIALVFEKPSLRTRVSFTVGIQELGGQVVELTSGQKKNEEPEDSIRVLQGMVHGVMVRTFEHENLERMLTHAKVPVINGLSDLHHPCQALADLQTMAENFNLSASSSQRLKIAYIGDGNNVLHSLLMMFPMMGIDVHYACPNGYKPHPQVVETALARKGRGEIHSFKNPQDAVSGVHAIYTDVWTSMGQEDQSTIKEQAFAGYQINRELLSLANTEAIVMHCLPMVKGKEITAEVVESSHSRIFAQAENRLHAQKALLSMIYS